MTQPLRLVHASDFHLELPLHGLAEIPDHLRDLLIDAPHHAVEQVFETALAEDVDAVLLAGDLLHLDLAGPRSVVLLLDQFARLGERGIPIYWAGGEVDAPDSWPRSIELPANVHVFPVGRVETLDLARAGEIIAKVQGTSRHSSGEVEVRGFHRDAHGLFTIGVAHGTSDSAGHEGDRVHYMALGSRHQHQTVDEEPGIAHYSGTPQGRSPNETGPHGCTVVTVDETNRAKTRFVATDTVRWIDQALEVTASTKSEQLHDRMVERLEKLQAQHPGIDLFIRWNIRGAGPLVNRLRPNSLADELLVDLRRKFGERAPYAWSVSIDCGSPLSVPAEWYDQETCLGDFLRVVREFELHETPFDLRPFLPENVRDEVLESIAQIESDEDRAALLCRASKLGVDLLTLPLEEGDLPADG